MVRLHILKTKSEDLLNQIYNHRVYRELQAQNRYETETENIVRYYNSWFEELNEDEQQEEDEYRDEYLKAIKEKHEKALKKHGLVNSVARQKF